MRRWLGWVLAVACACALPTSASAKRTQLVFSYLGSRFPDGLNFWHSGPDLRPLLYLHATNILDDQGYAVFELDDETELAGANVTGLFSSEPLLESLWQLGLVNGWTLRARVRVVPQSTATDPAGGAIGIDLGYGMTLLFGSDPAASGGNLRIQVPAAAAELTIEGGSVYHLVELVYAPPQPGLRLLVDGVERISFVPAFLPQEGAVVFGSVLPAALSNGAGTGRIRYERIELEVRLRAIGTFQCNDGLDNDGDGLTDMDDPGCTSPDDDIEFDLAQGAPAFDAEVSLRFELGQTLPPFELRTVGVAPVHAPGGTLQYVRIPAVAGVDREPVATPNGFATAVELHAALPAGTLAASANHPIDALPVAGFLRQKLLLGGHPYDIDYALSTPDGDALGAGGSWVQLSQGTAGTVYMTAAPWTLGNAAALSETAFDPSVTVPVTRQGFVHGPLSETSTAARTSGVVQFVTPLQVDTHGVPNLGKQAAFGTLRIRFIPEPVPAALLGTGALLLAELGRRRAAKRRSS
ncbi:MAG TPA: hypothetical protein VMS55_12205 [Myxococcota bacterium]|nr:hypothetical protein [Myxococcota bacterium]